VTAHLIDVHHHILPPDYVAQVGDARIGPLTVSGRTPEWTAERSLEAMERNGIANVVTSISTPGVFFGDGAEARALARLSNDYAAGLRREHPRQFGFFAILPLPEVDGSLAEIEYALDQLKADGVGLMTNYGGRYPGEPAFAPVFDELNRRKAVVYFHPTAAPCGFAFDKVPAATLEFPFDTTRAIASLLFGGTFSRCRNIRFIFSHAGGAVPFLAERIARLEARPDFKREVPDGVVAELQRLYYDTALSANRFAFAALLALVPVGNVLFGSDYPFAPETTMAASVRALKTLGLAPRDLLAVERENALELFPRFST